MDFILKLFDRLTSKIPPNLLRLIRLGSILVWLIAATVVIVLSWRRGTDSAPQVGQDLSRAEIMDRVMREQNLSREQNPITTPDMSDMTTESNEVILPFEGRRRPGPGLAGESGNLEEKDNMLEQKDPSGLPFLGEENSFRYPQSQQPAVIPERPPENPAPSEKPRVAPPESRGTSPPAPGQRRGRPEMIQE